jgi:hypothetical protein
MARERLPADYRSLSGRSRTCERAGRVQSAPMSQRPLSRDAASRAEARRRARLAARSEPGEEPPTDDQEAPPIRRGGSLLTRLFPPAAPLPGRPDPFANFHYAGPLRVVVANLYLLARNPLAWVLPGLIWAASRLVQGSSSEALVASLVSFGVLIAAGWFGWQRPSLFGAAAGALGYLVFLVVLLFLAPALYAVVPPEAVLINGLLYIGLGLISGWYGGYLRRRQAQVSLDAQRNRRRR